MQSIEPEIKVFISYAHEDQKLYRKLQDHLSTLKSSKEITIWQEQEILTGVNWEDQTNPYLNEADMILLLLSPTFMASNYYLNKEVKIAIEQYKVRTALIIPIVLRPVIWQNTLLGHFKGLPKSSKAIAESRNRDTAFKEVVLDIKKAAESLRNTWRQGAQRTEKMSEPADLQTVQMIQLIDAPAIAAQRGWKSWVATFNDVSVSYVPPNPSGPILSIDDAYVATGTNKKEIGTFYYTSRPEVAHLYNILSELYGRQDAVESSQWVVKEIFSFLH